jgi:glycosyltransferase involved in cell wall biosynthesis
MHVLMLTGGGISNRSGGVGTMMAALQAEWGPGVTTEVIDTRGRGGILAGAACFAWALARFVSARDVDVVHLHMTTRGSVARKCVLLLLSRALRRPAIVHMHGADFFAFHDQLPLTLRRLLAATLRLASHVVVLGEGWRQGLLARTGLAPSQVSIIRNGVPAPHACGRTGQAPVHLLFLGRLGARKGVPAFLAALVSRPMLARSWRATLAGDGDVAHFTAAIARSGLAGRVDLPGWVDRAGAAALMASADILVLPSFHEALPMAVVEAMAHGVAVIATPVGALPEILCDSKNAILVPPGDVSALTAALVRLIDDPALRRRLGQAGHAVFLAELDVAVTARQMFALYASAVRA